MDDSILCTIEIPNPGLYNDYTFFKNGKILRKYDRHIYRGGQNLENWLVLQDIRLEEKKRLLENCPPEYLNDVKGILGYCNNGRMRLAVFGTISRPFANLDAEPLK